jgi:hypothetical protein
MAKTRASSRAAGVVDQARPIGLEVSVVARPNKKSTGAYALHGAIRRSGRLRSRPVKNLLAGRPVGILELYSLLSGSTHLVPR